MPKPTKQVITDLIVAKQGDLTRRKNELAQIQVMIDTLTEEITALETTVSTL